MPWPSSLSTGVLTADFRKWLSGAAQEATVYISSPNALVSQSDNVILPRMDERIATSGGLLAVTLPVNNDSQWLPNGWRYLVRAVFDSGRKMAWLADFGATSDLADIGVEIEYPSSLGPFIVEYPLAPAAFDSVVDLTMTGRYRNIADDLLDAATIVTNAALGNHFRVTLTGNRVLGNPTNLSLDQLLSWEVAQDNVGSRLMTFDSKFAQGPFSPITLSTTGGKRDFIGGRYNPVTDLIYILAFAKGY